LPLPRRTGGTLVLLGFAFLSVYFTGFFPPSNNPNELSRIQLVVSVVDDHSFRIDRALAKYGDHEDKSVFRGHFYSNKAPGLSFAMVPVYWALRTVFQSPATGTSTLFVFVRLLTVSLACFVAAFRFSKRIEETGRNAEMASLVTFAVLFGTPFLYYSRSLFSHAWTASLLFLAWDALRESDERPQRSAILTSVSGFLAGWAVLSEYTAAPIAILLALRALAGRRIRPVLFLALGAVVPAAVLLLYDASCFGSPWSLSSSHEALPSYAALAHHGLFGIERPRASSLLGSLFGSSRGAVLFSPFWIWALPGFIGWWQSKRRRADWAFCLASTTILIVLLAGYPNWEGGWCLGDRYLLPAIFFAALSLPFGLETPISRFLFALAAGFSVANFALLTSSWPHIPPSFHWPVASISWWFLSRGWVAPSLGKSLGLSPAIALLPVVAAFALAASAAARSTKEPGRMALGLGCGVALLALTLALPPRVSAEDQTWRANLFNYLGHAQ
jgi:hypothetical protein